MLVAGLAVPRTPAFAEGSALTLSDAIATALQRNGGVQISALEAGQARDALGVERSSYLPRLALTSGAGYSDRQNEKLRAVDAEGHEKVYGLQSIGARDGWFNVEVSQLIFDLESWRRIDQRALGAEAAAVAADEQRDTAVRDVTVAYANVLRSDELNALAAERVRQAAWLDQQSGVLARAGRALASEREQSSIAIGEAELDARLRADQLAEARAALQRAVGDPDLDVSRLDPGSMPAADLPKDDVAADRTLAATPALRVLDLRKRVEESGVGATRAERYPTVDLHAGYSNYGPNRYDNYPDEVGFHLGVRVPLFDGNRTTYAVASATKAAEIAALRYRTMFDEKRARVRDLVSRLAAARERADLAGRRAALSREQVRLVDLRLQAQRATLGEAEAARDVFGRDATAAIEARYDRIQIWTDLMAESGRLRPTLGADREPASKVAR